MSNISKGAMIGKNAPSVEARFWQRVNKTETCWFWTGQKNDSGYGIISTDGRGIRAHRFSYILHCGEIPAGMIVCHKCDVRSCVNPDHLFLGTNADNHADMVKKNRQSKPPPAEGCRNKKALFKDWQVEEMRRLRKQGMPIKQIAKLLGIQYQLAWRITTNRSWRHVPP